jgi:hypothetical protein
VHHITFLEIAYVGANTVITDMFQSSGIDRSTFATVDLLDSTHLFVIDEELGIESTLVSVRISSIKLDKKFNTRTYFMNMASHEENLACYT